MRKTHVAGTIGMLASVLLSLHAAAAVRPAGGDLYYDGAYYADSVFYWTSPGPFSGSGPGYEHDLAVDDGIYGACTSFTNLPNGYDDCITAGISDPPGFIIFSFGSYNANEIQANTVYYGGWYFSQPRGQVFGPVDLYAQNVEHYFCSIDWQFCMNGVSTTDVIPYPLQMNVGGYPTIVYW